MAALTEYFRIYANLLEKILMTNKNSTIFTAKIKYWKTKLIQKLSVVQSHNCTLLEDEEINDHHYK